MDLSTPFPLCRGSSDTEGSRNEFHRCILRVEYDVFGLSLVYISVVWEESRVQVETDSCLGDRRRGSFVTEVRTVVRLRFHILPRNYDVSHWSFEMASMAFRQGMSISRSRLICLSPTSLNPSTSPSSLFSFLSLPSSQASLSSFSVSLFAWSPISGSPRVILAFSTVQQAVSHKTSSRASPASALTTCLHRGFKKPSPFLQSLEARTSSPIRSCRHYPRLRITKSAF